MSKTKVEYDAFAIGAKDNFVAESDDKEYFVDMSLFQKNEKNYKAPVNPCDMYSVILDGSKKPTDEIDLSNVGYISLSQSGNEYSGGAYSLSEIPKIVLTEEKLYSSNGITIVFDEENNIFPKTVSVSWYKDDQNIIGYPLFRPCNSPVFTLKQNVSNYNKIVLSFYSMNMPSTKLRIKSIQHGVREVFSGSDLANVSVSQSLDPSSSTIEINTANININSKANFEYYFEEKQPITIYFDDKIIQNGFISKSQRKSKTNWNISVEDHIGFMEDVPFEGGIYNGVSSFYLIDQIMKKCQAQYQIEDGIEDEKIYGHIQYTDCRKALQQIVFAIRATVDTSYGNTIKIKRIKENISQKIRKERIFQGQSITKEKRNTVVEVHSHKYVPIDEEEKLYENDSGQEQSNVFVKFSNPMHDLNIKSGEILSFGDNYAIINAFYGCVLTGKKYDHITTIKEKRYDNLSANDLEKVVSVKDATLVSENNVDNVLEWCYNNYRSDKKMNLSIVEGKRKRKGIVTYGYAVCGEEKYGSEYSDKTKIFNDVPTKVGDVISSETEYYGNFDGIITKQNFGLNGNIIVKKTEMRGL